ncbi:C39 family peptidase, partial [Micromonospora sp. LZ34]
MRTDILRKTALTVAGLAVTGGAIATPATAVFAAPAEKPSVSVQADRKDDRKDGRKHDRKNSERELGVRYEAQPNFYYCGPAATRNALSVQGKEINVDAMAEQMGTTEAGTDSINDITPVL